LNFKNESIYLTDQKVDIGHHNLAKKESDRR